MPKKKAKADATQQMFRDPSGQVDFLQKSLEEELASKGPVECLGMTFENDERRREYFLLKLGEKLKDPDFRKIEGFPIGEDEDILALSDPPYYTACPNPFLPDLIHANGDSRGHRAAYTRPPFAADVSEGKADPIYNAHSYHTKVPHKAIMRYILHYTDPGDVVLDGFCGTGMTGVAGQMCGDRETISELGLLVDADGIIRDASRNEVGKLGPRRVVLNDLSPAATLIAAGYNLTSSPEHFVALARQLLDRFDAEYGWMYQTEDPKTAKLCPLDFTVWSEVFTCPHCSGEIEFWSLAYDEESGQIEGTPECPHCKAEVTKRDLIRKSEKYYDPALKTTRTRQVLKPVLVEYQCFGRTKQKAPDNKDLKVFERVQTLLKGMSYPTDLMMFVKEGEEWGDLYRGYHSGISRVHDFFLPRQLLTTAVLWNMGETLPNAEMKRLWRFLLQSVLVSFTRRNRFLKNAFSQVNRSLSGTLYIGSTVSEPSPRYVLSGKIKRFVKALPRKTTTVAVTTQSFASIAVPNSSVDYAFIDPPFGDNLPYAELNFLWEAMLRVFTRPDQEAVVSGKQRKDILVYTELMTSCLRAVYRVLKPGRWVTVEFHNSKNAIWTAIQEALGQAGFVVADVRILDKGMLTKKQLHAKAVNKDLVISAYKPNGGFEDRFELEAGTAEGVWDFARTHLKQLPVFVAKDGLLETVTERQKVLLFDRMVAFHVQRGVMVPMSAAEFYNGLVERFPEREGMYFLPEQVAQYDKARMTVKEVQQLEIFVTDEASAIEWLNQQLTRKPQTFREVHPLFIKELGGWRKNEKPLELLELLGQNFLSYDGQGDVPSQIHGYLSTNFKECRKLAKDDPALQEKAKDRWYVPDPNKAGDLERLREKALLREFWEYLPPGYAPAKTESAQGYIPGMEPKPGPVPRGKKMKIIRMEAVRAGFKQCWQTRDYRTIIAVAQRIPEDVLQEDPKLLMWYDQALTRTGGDE